MSARMRWVFLALWCVACSTPSAGDPCPRHVRIQAHDPIDEGAPYNVAAGDHRVCFATPSPFSADDLATSFQPMLADDALTHHLVLYRTATAPSAAVMTECVVPAGAELLATWSPGAPPFALPEDTGLRLATGEPSWLLLEVHYLALADRHDEDDESGFDLCVTNDPLPHVAGLWMAGTSAFEIPPRTERHEVTTECRQRMDVPLRVVAASAHMHAIGRALRAEVLPAETPGRIEPLVDVSPFVYDRQAYVAIDPPRELMPGDRLRTTCVFDNLSSIEVGYGTTLADEMCLLYLVVDPIDVFPAGIQRVCH